MKGTRVSMWIKHITWLDFVIIFPFSFQFFISTSASASDSLAVIYWYFVVTHTYMHHATIQKDSPYHCSVNRGESIADIT